MAARRGGPGRWAAGLLFPWALAAAPDAPEKTPPFEPVGVPRVEASRTEAVRKAYLEGAKAALDRLPAAAADRTEAEKAAAALWEAGGEDSPRILKSLLKDGGDRGISSEHAKRLWEIRNEWFFEAAERICRREKVDIGFLDSGTEGSIASDTDKTHRILKRHGDPPSAITEAEISDLIKRELALLVHERTGRQVSLAALDIEVFRGDNFYPAWWEATEPAVYKREAFRVLRELQSQPAAYVTDSAQKAQVIVRAVEKHDRLKETGGPGAAFVRVRYDPATGRCSRDTPDDWLDMLSLSGEFLEHDPAGSALGNLLMLFHKTDAHDPSGAPRWRALDAVKDDIAKYHLRVLLDTAACLDAQGGRPFERPEPGQFPDEKARRALAAKVCGVDPVAGPEEAARLDGYARAMEISQDLAANKKARAEGRPAKPDDEVFRALAVTAAGSEARYAADTEAWQQRARESYARLAEEVSMRALSHGFPAAVKTWLDPDPKVVKRAARYDPRFGNQNIRTLGMVLLVAAHDGLPPGHWARLVEAAPPERRNDLEALDRMLRWGRPGPKPPAPPPAGAEERAARRGAREAAAEALRTAAEAVAKRFPVRTKEGGLFSVTPEAVRRWAVSQAQKAFPEARRFDVEQAIDAFRERHGATRNAEHILEGLLKLGGPDSLLGLAQAWQASEGKAPEERRKAVRDALFDQALGVLPYYGPAQGMWKAAESGDATGFLETLVPAIEGELAAAGLAPAIAGPIIAQVAFSRKLVQVIGHEIFVPLRADSMDVVYKGYLLPSEAGLLRAGRAVPQGWVPTSFPPLLSKLPVAFAWLEGETLEGLLHALDAHPDPAARAAYVALVAERDRAGGAVFVDLEPPYAEWCRSLREEIHDLSNRDAAPETARVLEERSEALTAVLRAWESQAALQAAVNERRREDPTLEFEVRRQNVYARFHREVTTAFQVAEGRLQTVEEACEEIARDRRQAIEALWHLRGATLSDVARERERLDGERQRLAEALAAATVAERRAAEKVGLLYVEDWTHARGDFQKDDETLAAKWVWHDEETRKEIASRLADDYVASRRLTLAAAPARALLRQLKDAALEAAADARARRLAAAGRDAVPQARAGDAETLALALGPPADRPPRVEIDVAIVESADPSGGTRADLQIEGRAVAVPAVLGDRWALRGPEMRRADVSKVPPEELSRLRLKPEEVGDAYTVTLELAAGDGEDPAAWPVIASAARWLVTRKRTEGTTVARPESKVPPLRLVAIEGDGADPPARRGRKRFDLPAASADAAITLDAPDSIVPGEPFELRATFAIRGALKRPGDAAPEIAVQAFGLPEARLAAGPGGRFEGKAARSFPHRFRLLGKKAYEWNFVYDLGAEGEPAKERWLRYTIRSDAPSFDDLERTGEGERFVEGEVPVFRSAENRFRVEATVRIGDRTERMALEAVYDIRGETLARGPAGAGAREPPPADAGAGPWKGGPGGPPGSVTRARYDEIFASGNPAAAPELRALVDEWLAGAEPAIASKRPGRWRYEPWGRPMGPGMSTTGPPSHPAGWDRHRTVWSIAGKLDSLDHCTMEEWVKRRLAGESCDACRGRHARYAPPAEPPDAKKPPPDGTPAAAPRPILVVVLDDGPFSRRLEAATLADPRVKARLAAGFALQIHRQGPGGEKRVPGGPIRGCPTLRLFDPKWTLLRQRLGHVGPEDLLKFLDAGAAPPPDSKK